MSKSDLHLINTGKIVEDPNLRLKVPLFEEESQKCNYSDARDRLISVAQPTGFSDQLIGGGKKPFESKESHDKRMKKEQIKVYMITYISYALIHAQREFWSLSKPYITAEHPQELTKSDLSKFDTAQLFFYAFFLYVCGVLGDSYNQRHVLTIAFFFLTIFFALLSLPGFFGWTSHPYYYFVQIFIGVFNSFLLPCMIAIMGNWFPKKNRGFIVGMWATCNNFGNIAGIQVAAWLLHVFDGKWQWLMIVATVTSGLITAVVFFYLIPHPLDVGLIVEELSEEEVLIAAATEQDVFDNVIRDSIAQPEEIQQQVRSSQQFRRLSMQGSETSKGGKISFWRAWLLPRVMLYSSAFFCTKLAVYALLLQLPTFLKTSELYYSDQEVANLSTLIDIGAMLGSIALGFISDLMYGKRSPVALMAVLFAIVISFVLSFNVYDMSQALLFLMMFFMGFFISGLNNMISASCSADLGKQEALKGNTKAISTVTGIIDGTGTLGTAAGQFIISYTSTNWGWQDGYLKIIAFDITLTLIPIIKIVYDEFKELRIIQSSAVPMGLNGWSEIKKEEK